MRIEATDGACAVIEKVKGMRSGNLTITIGTGCCESTAPFLYEDFWPGPDQAVIGEVAGVEVFAPEYLRRLYPDGEMVRLDVVDEMVESLSIETELGCRLALRGERSDSVDEPESCPAPSTPSTTRQVTGQLPEALRRSRMR